MTSPFADPMRVKYGQLDVTDHPYGFEFGVKFGAGENLYEALAGLLSDGESVTSTRTSNREFPFVVWIEAPTLDQIEDPEYALIAEAERPRNELTIWPGDNATPFVIETFRAQVDPDRSEDAERAGMRRFVLTVKALPFVRALEPTVSEIMSAPPPPVAPVVVTVDDCTSAANWTASPSPAASNGGNVYNITWARGGGLRYAYLTRTGSIDMSGTPYLVVEWCRERKDWSTIWTPPILNPTSLDGPPWNPEMWRGPIQTTILDAKWARSVWRLPTGTPSPRLVFATSTRAEDHRLYIRNIERTDQIPAPRATGHQLSRTIEIGGSARTQASLHLWHDDDSLGDVFMHTSSTPDGMFSCEPFLVGSGTTAGGTVTSTEKALDAGRVWNVPASMFNPNAPGRGLYARMRRPGTGPITVTVQPMRDTTTTGAAPVGDPEVKTFTPPAMSTMQFVSLGVFNMPPRRVDGEAALMKVTVQGAGAVLDDLWFADVDTGALTWVNGLVGLHHLWTESPTLDEPLPRVRAAMDADGRGGYEVDPVSKGHHSFPPGPLYIYTVATDAESSKIQLKYFERGVTHLRR